MDFASIKRTSFDFVHAKPNDIGDERQAGRAVLKASVRRAAQIKEASEILGALPQPGESVHVLMTGRYDLMTVFVVILEAKAAPCRMRLATLSYNKKNASEILNQIDAGRISQLDFVCSAFFRDNDQDTFLHLRQELAKREGSHRLAAARNHCKVATFLWPDRTALVCEGSANLRSNSNQEQFCVINDRGLHDWHASWIDEMVTRHEGDGDNAEVNEG